MFDVLESCLHVAAEKVGVFIDARFNGFQIIVHSRFKALKTSRNHMREFVEGN